MKNRTDFSRFLTIAIAALIALSCRAQTPTIQGTERKPTNADIELAADLVYCGQQMMAVALLPRDNNILEETESFAAAYNKRAVMLTSVKFVQGIVLEKHRSAMAEVAVKMKDPKNREAWLTHLDQDCRALAAKVIQPQPLRDRAALLTVGAKREYVVAQFGEPAKTHVSKDGKREVMSYIEHTSNDLLIDAFGNIPVGQVQAIGSQCDFLLENGALARDGCN